MSSMNFRANLGTGFFGLFLLFIGLVIGELLIGLLGAAMLGVAGYLFITRDEYGVPWWHATLRGLSMVVGIFFVFIFIIGTAIGLGAGRDQ